MDGVPDARAGMPRLDGAAYCRGGGAAGIPGIANGESNPPFIMIGAPPNMGAQPPAVGQPAPLRAGTASRHMMEPSDQRSRESASLRMRTCLRPGFKVELGRA